ncbi:hypothetical protein KZZ52_44505 [Dactylosporangium sp. AC04546]|uniref:hypothetical protein n=1 Tax=Dactylosporangium sp. AC04546 TaxID=2862460 RepID=UPI001EDFE580|nr:hypothetical protein [Dactylosporangium sp. AC04546]WVK80978.1 hypothetical protein KZZ52_44505 [Dactylosporangium sp. AC04546]
MESTEARDQLLLVERAAAAPYVQYPPSPWWYAPAVGAWTAALIGAFVWWRENGVLFTASLGMLVSAEVLFLIWMRRRHGAMPMPGHGKPPAEIAAVWRGYFAGVGAIAVLVTLAWWLGGVPVAAAVAFVLVTAGIAIYERKYAIAAGKVRDRLA